MKIGRITLSDRASAGVYADESGPEIERILAAAFDENITFERVLLPDDRTDIESALRSLVAQEIPLIVTTGGTGPSPRDVTPEATRAVLEKELPGFGELMRMHSYAKGVKTAILSRATAGVARRSLIVNLPGRPSAVADCLPLLLPALADALDHVAGFKPRLRS